MFSQHEGLRLDAPEGLPFQDAYGGWSVGLGLGTLWGLPS